MLCFECATKNVCEKGSESTRVRMVRFGTRQKRSNSPPILGGLGSKLTFPFASGFHKSNLSFAIFEIHKKPKLFVFVSVAGHTTTAVMQQQGNEKHGSFGFWSEGLIVSSHHFHSPQYHDRSASSPGKVGNIDAVDL